MPADPDARPTAADLPRPVWMSSAASVILEKWKEWEGEACQASTVAQSDEAGDYVLLGRIEQAIADAYERD